MGSTYLDLIMFKNKKLKLYIIPKLSSLLVDFIIVKMVPSYPTILMFYVLFVKFNAFHTLNY